MRSLTSYWKDSLYPVYPVLTITFADGQVLTLDDPSLFKISGNSFSDAAGESTFPVGVAICKTVTIALWNEDDRYRDYSFYMAKVYVRARRKTTLSTGKTSTSTVVIGTFTITTPESYGNTVEFTALDDMYKADAPYEPTNKFPCTVWQALYYECLRLGITQSIQSTFLGNNNITISEAPQDITSRQFIAYVAQLAGCNARMNASNSLQMISVKSDYYNTVGDLYGGIFDSDTPYSSGDTADGGTFNPWNTGYVLDAGTFSQLRQFHVLSQFKSDPSKSTDDFVITGIQYEDSDGNTYLSGAEGYVLALENDLISGKEQTVADNLASKLVGLQVRPFEGEVFGTIAPEFGDIAYFTDWQGRSHKSIITDVDYTFGGYTTIKCSADDPLRNSSVYNAITARKVLQKTKKLNTRLSAYDEAVQDMNTTIANSMGLFMTYEEDSDGGRIIYMHDEEELDESNTIWRMSDGVFSVSTDGGTTWNAGITSSGNVLVNCLSAIGISFDWAQGGQLTLGGKGNGNGVLVVQNANSKQIGKWDKDGIVVNNGTFSGTITADGDSTFGGTLSAAKGTFAGNLSAAGGTFNGNVTVYGKESYESAYVRLHNGSGTQSPYLIMKDSMGNTIAKLNENGLTAEAGTFKGTIQSEDGTVGGWTISSSQIKSKSGNMILKNTGKIASDSTSLEFGSYSLWCNGGLYLNLKYNSETFADDLGGFCIQGLETGTINYNIGLMAGAIAVCRSSSSSKRYKDIQADMTEKDIDSLYNIQPVMAKYKDGYLRHGDQLEGKVMPMFIAEDVEEHLPEAVLYEDGQVEDWNYRVMIPAMFQMIKSQKAQIDDLNARLEKLEALIKEGN